MEAAQVARALTVAHLEATWRDGHGSTPALLSRVSPRKLSPGTAEADDPCEGTGHDPGRRRTIPGFPRAALPGFERANHYSVLQPTCQSLKAPPDAEMRSRPERRGGFPQRAGEIQGRSSADSDAMLSETASRGRFTIAPTDVPGPDIMKCDPWDRKSSTAPSAASAFAAAISRRVER
jgi:hypothetical protein